ncbi:MAG: winged helix-turn-helix transcriptional regulator [Candidatus Heimdallarchaeota archaeon]|nr:MAG: winged helix-turn-helix transcriptional regulator [Candidatus Heimdallarchaeota archaeon]
MDLIDKNVLIDLLINCRARYQDMAVKNNVTANAIRKRVDRLISQGIIEDFIVELSLAMVDAELLLSLIYTDGSEDEKAFIDQLSTPTGTNPYINYIGPASGGEYNLYIIFSTYTEGPKGLSESSAFFRSFNEVQKVDMHPLLYPRGKKVNLSTMELKVLRYLFENPRMPISEISNKSGVSSRNVRNVLVNFARNNTINLTIRWNLNAGDSIQFLAQIQWDDKKADINSIKQWLFNQYPNEFWGELISATRPLLFGTFVVNNLSSVAEITQSIKKNPSITSVVTLLGKPSRGFPDIRTTELKKLIAETGL